MKNVLIKFHDPAGTPHFGQATITRTTSVNGGLSLTGEVFAGGDVLNGLDYGWWLNFDNEKYVITYKKLSDDTNTVVFDAVQQFFWDFAKVALHAQYTGSHEYTFYLGQLFDKSGYTYKNDVTVPAFEKENWGYKNKLDLFNDIIDQAGVEFEVHNETVHIAKQIGSDLTSFARKGINLSDLTEEMKISDFATYAKGYGAFKDTEDQSKGRLEVEYRSELAKQFGDLEMDPIVDERYTIADNLIAALKKQVDATYTVSMTMNIYDLENAGYPNYEAPKVGDWILAIDEALNFKRKIRIIQLEEQFDVTGKRIGYTATCGDLSIVDQYTHLQISLDSKVQRIQESIDSVAVSANGKNSNYYGAKEPVKANEGDLWFDQSNSDPDKWTIKQWSNGRWEQITLNPGEISDKVNAVKAEAESAVENAKSASEKADQLAAKYDDTNSLASQAFDRATSAQSEAGSAIAKAESTASEFGKVSQKADSAFDNAMSAQNAASSAVAKANSTASGFGKVEESASDALSSALNAQSNASAAVAQASSAAADSKDAKQIAGAVSQSYQTLTDGSTMTIAELESGLAVKLTKSDLDGYATQTWTQNQVKMTADGINGTMSSIKSTVDGQTTSINDLKADSSSFKSQFTTVSNTLGKQTTDIGTLQASSKELTSGFNTLTSDNTTNKNDISQLKQTATEVSSTLETIQTQVQNSAVGTNLIVKSEFKNGHLDPSTGGVLGSNVDFHSDNYIATNGATVFTFSSPDYTFKGNGADDRIAMYDSDKNYLGYQPLDSPTQTLSLSNAAYIRFSINSADEGNTTGNSSDWLANHRYKLEKGSVATDYSVNPEDTTSVTAFSKLSQTVDGMKSDISKKIEQKDLNGYATETWAQNQINATADGINATLSSVKSTVDGQTTDINDLQADSKGFKDQFTTVNDTLDKQHTDIGTLQADSKKFSSNFDSLDSDNKTNQHDISELQQTATKVSSTLETVQTQVQNSAVGTNLLIATRSMDYSETTSEKKWYYDKNHVTVNENGMVHVDTSNMTNGSTDINQLVRVQPSTDYTYTIQLRSAINSSTYGEFVTLFAVEFKDAGKLSTQIYTDHKFIIGNSDQRKYTNVTFKTQPDCQYIVVYIRVYYGYIIDFETPKLELGTNPTDWCPNPADNATVTAVSSISQTVEKIQGTVANKADQSKVTQLANQITSVVGDLDNLIIGGDFEDQRDYLGNQSPYWYGSNTVVDNSDKVAGNNPSATVLQIPGLLSGNQDVTSKNLVAVKQAEYNVSLKTRWSVLDQLGSIIIYAFEYDANKNLIVPQLIVADKSPHAWKTITATYTPSSDKVRYIAFDITYDGAKSELLVWVDDIQLGLATATQSQIAQLKDDISLKVEKNGVINAINVSAEGASIYGKKLWITADTYIDNAVIKNAMIESINADKIQAGSIDADKIQVIHLNANNITTGTINGSNLSINLNTGNVEFQKGRIHSSDNGIDININSKYISVANNNNRVFISGGEIQMIEPRFLSYEVTPYVRISNEGAGSSIGGATFWARDYFAVTHQYNDSDMFSSKMGTEGFSGIAGGHSTGGWEVTKVGGADRGVVISGGNKYSNGFISYSPYIRVGDNGNAGTGMRGSNIVMEGDYIFLKSQHTSSHGANAYLAPDGALVASTSAAKYKTDIVRSFETEMGNKLLEVPVAHWKDKEEVLAKTRDSNAKDPETYFGMIADDLDDAGLKELVEYDDKGAVRGIQYDRVALSLIPLIRNYRDRITELETKVKEMKEA